jgi:hypothetical protein
MLNSSRTSNAVGTWPGFKSVDPGDEAPGFGVSQMKPFSSTGVEQALNLRLGRLRGARGKVVYATVRSSRLEGERQAAQAFGKSLTRVGIAVTGMDEHRTRRRERIAATRRPVGEEQAPIHARHEGSQAATAGPRACRHFEMRWVTVARGAMGAPNFVGDFLRYSANDEFHGNSC